VALAAASPRACATPGSRHRPPSPLGAGDRDAPAPLPRQQWLFLADHIHIPMLHTPTHVSCRPVLCPMTPLRHPLIFPSINPIIIRTLRDQHPIRHAKVHRNRNHGRHQARPCRTDQIADIADEPDEEEGQRDGGGGGVAEVFEELGDLE
jgi:hypothetical protein